MAGSSDAPVIGASPLIAMRDAILRRTDGGRHVARAEAVSAAEALAMYTTRAAFVDWAEDADRLADQPGKLADFVVLGRDPLAIAPDRSGPTWSRRPWSVAPLVHRSDVPLH